MFLSDIINIIDCDVFIKDRKIKKIKTDSRLLDKGDLFICINSGYKYIEDAIKREVSAIIVDRDIKLDTDIPIIKVKDSIIALGKIAKYIRNQYKGVVIAITGSNGKTTTKELLSHVLGKKNKVLKSVGSDNNHIGVPNTILNLDNSYDYLVIELGTNHPGEIKYLTNIVKPDIAIITNIGNAHIGNFGSVENILQEKLQIKDVNTILFVNGEDNYLKTIEGIKVYRNDYSFKSPISHYQMNYNLVFKVCEYLGYNIEDIIECIKNFKSSESRMDKIIIDGITIIDDSYNASYESVIGGLDYIKKYNRKIVILGDMLELGEFSKKLHTLIKKKIDMMDNTILLTIGNEIKVINNDRYFSNLEDLGNYLSNFNYKKGDVIYLKGAHSMNLYKLVPLLKSILQK